MTKERVTVSLDRDVLEAAKDAVTRGQASNLSALVSDALVQHVDRLQRLQAMGEFLDAYEVAHGVITDEEIERTTREMRARAIVVRGRSG